MNADGIQSNQIIPENPKFLDHVVQPKKPTTGYFFFNGEKVKALRAESAAMTQTEALKASGALWTSLSEEERQKYEVMASNDKDRYQKELKDLITQGYFIMADGSKSSDHQAKAKKSKKNAVATQSQPTASNGKKLGKRNADDEAYEEEDEPKPLKKKSKK